MNIPEIPTVPTDPYLLFFSFWNNFANSSFFKPAMLIGGAFIFVMLMALVKKHIFEISMKGAGFGFLAGVIVMILLDLIFIVGLADKSKMSRLVSEENRQAVVQDIFISGVSGLGGVLGVSTTTTPKTEKPTNVEKVIADYLKLPTDDASKFKVLLCPR